MKRLPLIALALTSAIAASPLFLGSGFLNTRGGGDSPFLLFRLHQLYSALTQGVFPVRWMPDAAYGLGYPFFNYYAALPLYLASLFKLFGASYVLALKLTQFAGFALAALAMYGWMRSLGTSRLAAWLAAAAYTFVPFHLVNVFVRGDSLNEFFAFGLYPLCLWSARRLAEGPSLPRALPLALSYAALIATHNISALIFTPFLGVYVLAGTPGGQRTEGSLSRAAVCLLLSAFGLVLGLALSAFFWLPALREGDYGQLAPVTQGYFHYANHFRGRNLVQPSFIFNYDTGSAGQTPFAMGLAQAALAGLGLLVSGIRLVREAANTRKLSAFIFQPPSFFIVAFLAATFMMTRFSGILWDRLPLLPFVQFPWRFLSIQGLFASALIGWMVNSGARSPGEASDEATGSVFTPRAPRAALFAALLAAFCLLPSVLGLRPDFIPIVDAEVTPERLQVYEYFTGNIGTTINYEYLPRWTQPRPYSSAEFIFGGASLKVLAGSASGERLAKRAASQAWQINVHSDAASLAVPLLYWPGWEAYADGRRLDVRPAEGLGWIAFELPQGDHALELRLGQTGVRRNASLVSLIALAAVVALARPWRLSKRAASRSRLAIVLGAASIVLIAAVAGRLLNAGRKPVGAATMDFDQQGFLYSSAVTFGNGDVLQGYNYSATTLRPGDQLGVALQWRAENEAVFTLDLVSPAEHLLKRPHPGAAASASGPAQGQAGVLLEIPDDLASGVYLLRLKLFQHDLLAPAFTANVLPRGTLYLQPIRIVRADLGQDVSTGSNRDPVAITPSIQLLAVDAVQTAPTALDLDLHWQAAAPVPANYMLALRLLDAADFEIAALDLQPTGGVYPTGAWRVGEIVPESYKFDLPSGLPPGTYRLTLTLYDAASLSPAGSATVPILFSQWSPPPGTAPQHRFSDTLALHDVTLPASARAGDRLPFAVRWTSLAALTQDLMARWTAISPNGEVVAFEDHPLAAVPSSQWAAGALVMGRPSIRLPISARPGEYVVHVQLLDPGGGILSPPVAVGSVPVSASDRTTTVPPVQFESGASFGPITLAGYDAVVSAGPPAGPALSLNLVWQESSTMTADYKYFVHVFDPADETIAAQIDGFPPVPTSFWETGEVVQVAASLSLEALTPGTVYNLGVGWYDAETGDRLGQRVILGQGIVKP